MKKSILYILPAVLLFGACTKDISRFNNQTKRAAVVPAAPLYTNATRSLSDQMANIGGGNITLHIVGYMAQAIIEDNAQFNFQTAGMTNTQWNVMYRDVLNDLKRSDSILSQDVGTLPATITNQRACVDITAVYAWYVLVTSYGNVPYTEALNPNNLFPKYDDQKAIITDLLKRLDADLGKLSTAGAGFATSEDLWFAGNINNWISFGNSLKVLIGMTLADADAATSKSVVEAAAPKAISGTAQNAIMKYGSQPSNNPIYSSLVVAKRNDYIASKSLMDQLLSNGDPRLTSYFGKNSSGNYVGGVMGVQTTYSTVSGPSTKDSAQDFPYVVLDYAEMEFLRAEAIARGYNIPGTVESHYNEGIRQSLKYWGVADTAVTRYLAEPTVAFATAVGATPLQKIARQKWIALYMHPYHEWVDMRRLDYPVLPLPVGAVSGFPNRLYYPTGEQTINGANYTQAAAAVGGDKVETKLFWDKN
ncbi:MAG: SusD/RagB family nutrient-binding outer membrane lipoprotein [Bacteroidetes bacterium]|nr:SusD/RagB family nutrient-binding outer membrane lipoprotein [Bacteroidota bacterium]